MKYTNWAHKTLDACLGSGGSGITLYVLFEGVQFPMLGVLFMVDGVASR